MVSEKVNWMSIKDAVYSPPAKIKLIKLQEALVMGKIWTLRALNFQRFLEVLKSHVIQSLVTNENKLQSWESSLSLSLMKEEKIPHGLNLNWTSRAEEPQAVIIIRQYF